VHARKRSTLIYVGFGTLLALMVAIFAFVTQQTHRHYLNPYTNAFGRLKSDFKSLSKPSRSRKRWPSRSKRP
jgi:hypothetical protein